MPGVLAVYTSDNLELPDVQGFIMLPPVFNRPPLAKGVVRFVGDIVAAVVAETRTQAVDAAEAVIVDYEPLGVVVDPEAAMEDGAPVLFEEHGSNVAFALDFGDDPTVLEGADVVVSRARREPAPRGRADGAERRRSPSPATARSPSRSRRRARTACATRSRRCSASTTRTSASIAPAVGGGFGAKSGVYAEYVVLGVAGSPARPAGEVDRDPLGEHARDGARSRSDRSTSSSGSRTTARSSGMKGRVVADAGAYPSIGAFLAVLHRQMGRRGVRGPEGRRERPAPRPPTRRRSPRTAVRAGPRPTQFIERALDIGAPPSSASTRSRSAGSNFIPPDAFPHTTVTGSNYDSGDYAKALDEACRVAGYDEPARRAGRARRANGRSQAPRHRRLVVRRDHRARPVPGVRQGRDRRRRWRRRHRRHVVARAGPRALPSP